MSDDDNKREIKIDPSFLKIRKEKSPKIKIKSPKKKETPKKNVSTLKKNLLRMIRGHQDARLKSHTSPVVVPSSSLEPPKSDFEQSIQFLSQINDMPKKQHNQTMRATPPLLPFPSFIQNTQTPETNPNQIPSPRSFNTYPNYNVTPQYGCLKYGNLPTYSTYKNQSRTQKRTPIIEDNTPSSLAYETELRNKIMKMSENEQHQKLKEKAAPLFKKPRKQKRTMRRTFRIGKSRVHPRVSVLVSNKTLRNQTNLKKTKLKETPMSDVKLFLKKQGFIKVGTNTPNDVLREMYESASMICGEVKNHSSENLLYNYFNNDDGPIN